MDLTENCTTKEETKFSSSELAAEYLEKGYVSHFNQIDSEACIESNCENCGHTMSYIGLKRIDSLRVGSSAYVAIAHCTNCRNEYEI